VGGEEERACDADEEGSGCAARGDEEVEQRCFGRALRAKGVGFGVAEEAGEEALGEEEEDGGADGEADVGLRDGAAETGQHDDEKTHDDAATVEVGKLKRE